MYRNQLCTVTQEHLHGIATYRAWERDCFSAGHPGHDLATRGPACPDGCARVRVAQGVSTGMVQLLAVTLFLDIGFFDTLGCGGLFGSDDSPDLGRGDIPLFGFGVDRDENYLCLGLDMIDDTIAPTFALACI